MRVKTLIEHLKKCDPEAIVKVDDWGEEYRAPTDIRPTKDYLGDEKYKEEKIYPLIVGD